ncbi:IS1595 family transposase ISEnu2 [Endozoicomonas sp. OPT23]|uniref:IS1595 family transposase n=3 Tax=Endozoicomonas sp. OPT23 TaxID=2072845 RepID=UPI00129BE7FF|nr:IS1595 family transposase ISEnu2 [Endozoicomonas sp. OPT23]
MQSELFQNFIDSIPSLNNEQWGILDKTLLNARIPIDDSEEKPDFAPVDSKPSSNNQRSTPDLATSILTHFAEQPVCPECKSHSIYRWGVQSGRQRYRCKSCKKTFNAFSATPLARLRYPEKWNNYLTGMTYSMTLRAAANEYNIDLKTSFRWRHRFLEVINNDQAEKLSGITELDETFFRESFKGQREGLPRPSRKRGNDQNKTRKVPVMVARDRNRHTVDGVLENESANELCRHLNGCISIEATVCADAHLAHEKLAEKLGFEFKELVTSAGQHVLEGIYHIQHVNSYHSDLKRWIGGVFRGVATRYLPHYLAWKRDLSGAVKLNTERFVSRIAEHWGFQLSAGT